MKIAIPVPSSLDDNDKESMKFLTMRPISVNTRQVWQADISGDGV